MKDSMDCAPSDAMLSSRRSFLKQTGGLAIASMLGGHRMFVGDSLAAGEDFTSAVPQYTFSDKLDEQLEQLKGNPLLRRFKESRKAFAADPHRPMYHFTSPECQLNDPNGLCYWQNRWHLFYQGYPPEDRRQHWGHAVSDDLIHWRDLPYAIYPHPERAVFSGATLVEKDRVIAHYHGSGGLSGNYIAISRDPLLLNWEKLTGNPVVRRNPPPPGLVGTQIFDPCIWKKDDMYYALSGQQEVFEPQSRTRAAQFLFRSPDLVQWEYLHQFVEGDVYSLVGDDGACPYFWPIGDRHILLYFSHMSGGKYLLGDYDKKRDKFVVTTGGDFNFGPHRPGGVHAPSATPDGKGGVIALFNINNGYATRIWRQMMSLPRRLTVKTDQWGRDALYQEPAGDIESLRRNYKQVGATALPANQEVVLDGIEGNTMEINAEIDHRAAPMIEINVLRSPNRQEYTRIAFYWRRGLHYRRMDGAHYSAITIDTSYSSGITGVSSRTPETAPVYLEPDESLKLRVFIDKSVVEVFVNGKQCVAVRVYPGRDDSLGVSLRSQGRDATLKSLDAWQMAGIFESSL